MGHIRIEGMRLDDQATEMLQGLGCIVEQEKGVVTCPEGSVCLMYPETEGAFGVIRFGDAMYMLWQRQMGDHVVFIGHVNWKDDALLFRSARGLAEPISGWLKELLLLRLHAVHRFVTSQIACSHREEHQYVDPKSLN